ncbi:hypothetical protein [Duganella vulcania]|uniref:Uncharacterized protein n=1 Tax=Duganella vulcania TaxID=2692166 RepID=A0A845GG14_9BURK|nr:hypothetical protein [Duganella vulcania]MYM92450.1 hypothetical protein [Duganella vulcania]
MKHAKFWLVMAVIVAISVIATAGLVLICASSYGEFMQVLPRVVAAWVLIFACMGVGYWWEYALSHTYHTGADDQGR